LAKGGKWYNFPCLAQKQTLRFLGIQCEDEWQGFLIAFTDWECRLPEQENQGMVYVDYLSTAHWNLSGFTATPRFRGVGLLLIREAVKISHAMGYEGRIGLHSLPQAEGFYRGRCGMNDVGKDKRYYNLRYFEMTAAQAEAFLATKSETTR
jgi:hypothetical protein